MNTQRRENDSVRYAGGGLHNTIVDNERFCLVMFNYIVIMFDDTRGFNFNCILLYIVANILNREELTI